MAVLSCDAVRPPDSGVGRSGVAMSAAEFRSLGHRLVDQIAAFHESLPERRLTTAKKAGELRALLPPGAPEEGVPAARLLDEIVPLLFDHSLHNGHPRFLGYISGSAAPFGVLADLLAAAVNANVAKWDLAPVASEIEAQTIRWIAEMLGYPRDCGGLMVSGGNSANFHAFAAARHAATKGKVEPPGEARKLTAYVSRETHTWIDKAAEICGLGAAAVRWIGTDDRQRMRLDELAARMDADRRAGCLPFLVVGTAGTVSTGAVDPLRELADFCRNEGIWLHVDGAYGAPAACLPEAPDDLHALGLADSVAVDPHKWLYSPLEAGCVLMRDPAALRNAFAFHPSYYHFDDEQAAVTDYYQHGLQNSRGFRALKVWLNLRRAGLAGYRSAIREDIALARYLYESVASDPDFEARSLSLSVTTFRYLPADLRKRNGGGVRDYLNTLNEALLSEVQKSGRAFVSNACVDGDYLLRACVVNFRTTKPDIDAVRDVIAGLGTALDARMRPPALARPVAGVEFDRP